MENWSGSRLSSSTLSQLKETFQLQQRQVEELSARSLLALYDDGSNIDGEFAAADSIVKDRPSQQWL